MEENVSFTASQNDAAANELLHDPISVSDAPTTAAESTVDTPNGEKQPPLTDPSAALVVAEDATEIEHTLSLPFQKRNERKEQAKRKKRQEKEAAKRKLKEDQTKAMEEETRSTLTTRDFILSQTLRNALKGKVEKVEELLESLQDEVWEAEEQQEAGETKRQADEDSPFSLLDQVLAMILGTMPIEPGMTSTEHYKKVDVEHKELVRDWKQHFGRLPPPAEGPSTETGAGKAEDDVPARSAQEQRRALGIPEAGVEDWEDEDEDEDEDDGDDNRLESAPAKEQDAVKQNRANQSISKTKTCGSASWRLLQTMRVVNHIYSLRKLKIMFLA
jgi:hypothetical protein